MTDACQFNETDFNYVSRRWETAGWPPFIFMPADLQKMLAENPNHRPDKTEKFGNEK